MNHIENIKRHKPDVTLELFDKTFSMPLNDFKIKMLFQVYGMDMQKTMSSKVTEIDRSFLGENTSFTLTFNGVALIINWNFGKFQEIKQIYIFL